GRVRRGRRISRSAAVADRAGAQLERRPNWYRSADRICRWPPASGCHRHVFAALGSADLWSGRSIGEPGIGTTDDRYAGYGLPWRRMALRIGPAAGRRADNGLLAIDGPYAAFADLDGLERSARRTATLGFDGKWVIHPSQIETVNQMYSPDPASYARAEGILAAYRQATEGERRGAVRFEGEMIDEATRKMAEAVARRGRWLGLPPPA